MAAGLKVCSASHCTGFLRMGSMNMDAGLGVITGFPLVGRVNGPMTQGGKLCEWSAVADKNIAMRNAIRGLISVRSQPLAISFIGSPHWLVPSLPCQKRIAKGSWLGKSLAPR